jgi:integrase
VAKIAGAWTVTNIHKLTDGDKRHGKKHTEPGGVEGLCIFVRGQSRIFQFRYNWRTKPTIISLGSIKKVTLADARAKARRYRSLLDDGVDPAMTTPTLEAKPASTFAEDTDAFFERERRGWDEEHARIWFASMRNYVLPTLGSRDTATISVRDVIDVLTPLWVTKHETAIRLHGRIRAVIGHAIKRAFADRDMERFRYGNPADMALDLMPKLDLKAPEPHLALAWEQAPALYQRLVAMSDRPAAWALRFLLLCCTPRTDEIIGALWSEIDLSTGPFGEVWRVPACRMKSAKARDIPLVGAALDLLDAIRPPDWTADTYIFRASRHGTMVDGVFRPFGHIREDAMNVLLKEMEVPSTVHGLRATFRSWVTAHAMSVQDHDAAETALDHVIGSRVARAYDRSDLLLQRRDLAERWAQYLMG